eukprot:TRINITY_DN30603_c0_g2_i1.p1 TRINITY_DN30603_c0_g2~~TRINITY_DN30603_c0_g2_i1.p1  ORF type:complete len:443 (+),score=51.52 TRINITY_DN30603_c0_g2_i1:136-1464(+)
MTGAMTVWQLQVWLLFGIRMVQTVLRMAMGPLIVYVCEEVECSVSDKGTMLSAFSLGYLSTQIIGGTVADRMSPRNLISVSMFLASSVTVLTPEGNAVAGLSGIWIVTVVMGIAQGPLFPASMSYLAKWLPATERSWAMTMLDSGITVGSLIALPLSGFLASTLGWRGTFRLYGVFGLCFTIVWHLLSVDEPDKCPYLSPAERDFLSKHVKSSKPNGTKTKDISGPGVIATSLQLLSHPAVWAAYIAHVAFNFGVYFLTSWTTIYYKDVLGVRPEEGTIHFTAPALLNLFMKAVVCKPLFSWLQGNGFSLLGCRRFFSVAGFVGTSVALMGAIAAKESGAQATIASSVMFTLALGFAALHPSGFKANYMDLSLHSSGLLSGMGNTFASVSSYIGPLVVGWTLERYKSWPHVFVIIASVNLTAALIFGTLSTVEPVDDDSKRK